MPCWMVIRDLSGGGNYVPAGDSQKTVFHAEEAGGEKVLMFGKEQEGWVVGQWPRMGNRYD